ncbi:chitobiase/beta-hexosaminidase C-terminal domain-containing protein [Reichenbachiella ulvae]|uniref:Chitobiase/beta-hexosaminidase C-terminal domain-containing protein n=1 Tax=Reichenbachiella ulvae TaxID=2980104 RepID=A0ABT3CXY6_9BACT|nr:chitobiase/beta-hexosaminidase C-terminal domain-containing protein [Reichenbachiella ulvae]MCV9388555.1 chitobiase/beta-hexosaminidase C-terminal domain-containing protein [Reichenbachiella ulvae]
MRKFFILLLLCPVFLVQAQEKQTVEANYYVGEDGKLYWHGKKPVYIFIADNPDGNNAVKLKSENQAQYTNPLYLDTEGVNYIRSNWAADSELNQISPKIELLFEVYRDSEAPVTKVSLDGASYYKNSEGKQYFGKGLKLAATANDRHSGVQKTFYSINNAPFSTYSEAVALSQGQKYDVKIYSADNTGNVEAIQMFNFEVDMVAPKSKYTAEKDYSGMIFSPRTLIKISAEDLASGVKSIKYKIDEGTERAFGTQIGLSQLSEGDHSIKFFAVDQVGNQETEQSINFYLDKTVPEVEATIVGDQYQSRGRVFISTRTKVKLTAEDNKAGVKEIKYSLNGGEIQTYYEPFAIEKGNGSQVVTYFATDNVNNTFEGKLEDKGLSRAALNIDMSPPEVNYSFSGKKYISRDTAFITSQSTIDLSATDNDSGVKNIGYKINGETGQDYEGPIKIAEEGYYNIDFYATDQVNNRNTKNFAFVVDNTGPAIENIISMESIGTIELDDKPGKQIKVYSSGTKLFLGATDKVLDTDKIYYTIDGKPEVEYTKPITLSSKGLVTYSIRATDKLGNETKSEVFEIFIK